MCVGSKLMRTNRLADNQPVRTKALSWQNTIKTWQFYLTAFFLLAGFTLFAAGADAAMRDRVKIVDGNVVSDTGKPLRTAAWFMDVYSVDDVLNNQQLYRDYFREISTTYKHNAVRISPWMGDWNGQWHVDYTNPDHAWMKDKFTQMIDLVVDWAEEDGIYAVVNMHIQYNSWPDVNKTNAFWTHTAPRYKDKTHVVYELVNEPNISGIRDNMVPIYNHARAIAPDTHMILWSVENPKDQFEITLFDTTSDDAGEISYDNASIGFHSYAQNDSRFDKGVIIRDAGYPVICTEYWSLTDMNDLPIDYDELAIQTKYAEDRGLSWMSWAPRANYRAQNPYNPPQEHHEIAFSQQYMDAMAAVGLSWDADNVPASQIAGNEIFSSRVVGQAYAGQTVQVRVDLKVEQESDLVIRLEDINSNYANMGGKRIRVQPGHQFVDELITVKATAPLHGNYKLQAFIAPVGGYYGTRYHDKGQNGVSVQAQPSYTNNLAWTVTPDSTATTGDVTELSVSYETDRERDVFFVLQDVANGYYYRGTERVRVQAGSGTLDVDVLVSGLAEAHNNYQWQVQLTDVNGSWNEAVKFLGHSGVSVVDGSSLPDNMVSHTLPMTVAPGEVVNFSVDYEAGGDRDIVIGLQDPTNNWQWKAYAHTTVSAGSGTANLSLTVDSDTPAHSGHEWQVLLTTPGGGYNESFSNILTTGVTVGSALPTQNKVVDYNFVSSVQRGELVTINVDYELMVDAKLKVLLQRHNGTRWESAGGKTVNISAGYGTQEAKVRVKADATLASNYKWQVFMLPLDSGKWRDRLHNKQKTGVTVSE